MSVCSSLEANAQSAVLMGPRVRSLNDPSIHSQSAPVSFSSSSNHRTNGPQLQRESVRVRVVRAISVESIRPVARMTNATADQRNGVDEGNELRHVVGIGGCQGYGQRDSSAVGDHVVLASRTGSVRRVWPAFFPQRPLLGSRTSRRLPETSRVSLPLEASLAARDEVSPTRRLRANREACASRSPHCHTPFPWAEAPKGFLCEGQTGCRSGIVDRRWACDPDSDSVARVAGAMVRSHARAGRREGEWPRESPSRCWGSAASIGTNPGSLSLILKGALSGGWEWRRGR